MHRSLIIILLIVLTFGACNMASAVTTTWPQTFSLAAGQTARYTFDVTAEGQITIDATWQTSQLTMLLADPSGNIVNMPPSLLSSPAKLLYTATAGDLQKGKEWTLTIYPPPTPAPGTQPVAVGSISVSVPVPGVLIVPGLRDPGIIRQLPGTPSIQTVTPNYGNPMNTVAIKGKNLPEDKNGADVWFTLAANAPTRGTILSTSRSVDGVTYQVQVPGNDYLYNSHQGPVYVKIRATGDVTNSLPFTFEPCAQPTITAHSPQYGKPGLRMTFTGTHFRPTDKVYFVSISGDVAGATSYYSTTQISAILPSDFTTNLKSIQAYVRYDCHTHWLNGPKYAFPLDPSVINAKPK